jgi:hypothetical protein
MPATTCGRGDRHPATRGHRLRTSRRASTRRAYARIVDDLADPFAAAKANLYSGALDHIRDWTPGRLEKRSFVPWSSQARRTRRAPQRRASHRHGHHGEPRRLLLHRRTRPSSSEAPPDRAAHPSLVEPTTSQNSAVITRRVDAAPCRSSPKRTPHPKQNRACSGFAAPHVPHRTMRLP